MARAKSLLVVVHPGSLCGSLDFHCPMDSCGIRGAIADEILRWQGDVAVVDGDLSDELERRKYTDLRTAIDATSVFSTYGSCEGDGLAEAAGEVVEHFGRENIESVRVTGAWNDRDGSGCVTAVANALTALGLKVEVSDRAATSDGD